MKDTNKEARIIVINRDYATRIPTHIFEIDNVLFIDAKSATLTYEVSRNNKLALLFYDLLFTYLYNKCYGVPRYYHEQTDTVVIDWAVATYVLAILEVQPAWQHYAEYVMGGDLTYGVDYGLNSVVELAYNFRLADTIAKKDIVSFDDILDTHLAKTDVVVAQLDPYDFVYIIFAKLADAYLWCKNVVNKLRHNDSVTYNSKDDV